MAAIPAGAAGALKHPDVDSAGEDDERSIWEKIAEDSPAQASAPTSGAADLDPRPVAVIPGEEPADETEPVSGEEASGALATKDTVTEDAAPATAETVAPKAAKVRKRPAKKPRVTTTKEPRPGWRAYRWSIVAAVVVLVLIAGVIVFAIQWFGQRNQEAQGDAASASARQTAVNLTSLNFNTIDAQVKQVIDQTTGDFRNEFTQNAEPFTNIVKVSKVESTSEIVGSGLQSVGDDKARVLVAIRSIVKNAQTPQPEVRNYRMAVDLQDEAGQWLTSNVEFVP